MKLVKNMKLVKEQSRIWEQFQQGNKPAGYTDREERLD